MNHANYQDINLASLALTREMVEAWRGNDKELFKQLRMAKLIEIEKEMLELAGLEVETNKLEND